VSATKICPQCSTQYEDDQRFCPLDGSTLKSLSGAADLVGSVIADRYHVIRKLGEGGMGQVYLAEHVRMGRKSAVKVLHPGMVHDADAISRFNREAANASRISHPNVAAIYDFGETSDGLIYLAMEFVEGEPLTNIIERVGALPASRAASIVRQAGEALAVAHEFGIVHRDLKPDNIMIARNRDGSDCVKVVDFGIAKAANVEAQKVTRTGLIVGTPEYMSPEQLAGDPLDGRSDIYSLALVGFAMLTGRLPFPSETAQESMIMRLTDRPRSLAEMKPEVKWPSQLQAVMDRALSREAASRYTSAAEFGHDFAKAIERMPQTIATEAGTSIINTPSMPQTAIAPAPTLITGATGAKAAVPPARRTRRAPLIIGGATVLLGAVIVFGVLRGNEPPGAADSSAATASRDSQPFGFDHTPASTASQPTTVTTPPNGTEGGTSAAKTGAGGATPPTTARALDQRAPAAGEANALSPAALKAEIAAIRQLTLGEQTAAEAVRRAEAILPRLRTGDDSAEVLLQEFDAYVIRNDSSRSCNALKRIGKRGNSIVRESVVSGLSNC
jgi:eukaryotic-like serine/threonine-protein kinase